MLGWSEGMTARIGDTQTLSHEGMSALPSEQSGQISKSTPSTPASVIFKLIVAALAACATVPAANAARITIIKMRQYRVMLYRVPLHRLCLVRPLTTKIRLLINHQ